MVFIDDITFKIKSVLTWNYIMQQWLLNNRINLMGLYNTFQTNAISNMLIFKCKTIDFEFTLSEMHTTPIFFSFYTKCLKRNQIFIHAQNEKVSSSENIFGRELWSKICGRIILLKYPLRHQNSFLSHLIYPANILCIIKQPLDNLVTYSVPIEHSKRELNSRM